MKGHAREVRLPTIGDGLATTATKVEQQLFATIPLMTHVADVDIVLAKLKCL